MIQEGKKAPGFKLKDKEGKEHSLSDFLGKKVVLYFYPKDDTPGCTKEACDFRDNLETFEEKNAVIIGVSPDDGNSHEKFISKYELPFVLLSDPEKKVLEKYDAWGAKSMYGRTYMGVIRSTVLIDEEGKVIKHYPKVRVTNHIRDILKEI